MRFRGFGVLMALWCATVAAPAWSEPAALRHTPDITRFSQVDERLFRGGQPDAAGFRALKHLGVRTIVNLRTDDAERAIVEGLGLNYVSIPIVLPPFSGDIPAESVRRFFEVVDDPANGPVFVHCRRGADRTGTLVGLYRIARQGWEPAKAYDEAREIGMRWWYGSMKGFLSSSAVPPRPAPPALEPAVAVP